MKNNFRSKERGYGTRGNDWVIKSNQALVRDNYCCQYCGKNKYRLEVHHIVPWSISANNNLENLVTVCRFCHYIVENFNLYSFSRPFKKKCSKHEICRFASTLT